MHLGLDSVELKRLNRDTLFLLDTFYSNRQNQRNAGEDSKADEKSFQIEEACSECWCPCVDWGVVPVQLKKRERRGFAHSQPPALARSPRCARIRPYDCRSRTGIAGRRFGCHPALSA
jgi:hypothetical protein